MQYDANFAISAAYDVFISQVFFTGGYKISHLTLTGFNVDLTRFNYFHFQFASEGVYSTGQQLNCKRQNENLALIFKAIAIPLKGI
jgi:hypothetical protein